MMTNPLWILFFGASFGCADVAPADGNSNYDVAGTWSGLAVPTYPVVTQGIVMAAKYLQAVNPETAKSMFGKFIKGMSRDEVVEWLQKNYKTEIKTAAQNIEKGLAELAPEAERLAAKITEKETGAFLAEITEASVCTVALGPCAVGFGIAFVGVEFYTTFYLDQQSSEAAYQNSVSKVEDLEVDFKHLSAAMLNIPPSSAGKSYQGVATLLSKVSVLSDYQTQFLSDVRDATQQVESDAVNRWNFMCHFDFFGICSPAIPDSVRGSLRELQQDLVGAASHTKALKKCSEQLHGCEPSYTQSVISDIKGKMESICTHLRAVVCSMPQQDGIDCADAPRCHKAVRGMLLMAAGRRGAGAFIRGARPVSRVATDVPASRLALAVVPPSVVAAPGAQLADDGQFLIAVTVLTVCLLVSFCTLITAVPMKERRFLACMSLACMVVSASGLTASFVHFVEEVKVKGLFAEVVDKFDHMNRTAVAWGCTADLELDSNLRSIVALSPGFHTDLTRWWGSAVALLLLVLGLQTQAWLKAGKPDQPAQAVRADKARAGTVDKSLAQPLVPKVENLVRPSVEKKKAPMSSDGTAAKRAR